MTINYATRKALVARAFEESSLHHELNNLSRWEGSAGTTLPKALIVEVLLNGLQAARTDVELAPTPETAEDAIVRYLESSISEITLLDDPSTHAMAAELSGLIRGEFSRFLEENPEPPSSTPDPDLSAQYQQVMKGLMQTIPATLPYHNRYAHGIPSGKGRGYSLGSWTAPPPAGTHGSEDVLDLPVIDKQVGRNLWGTIRGKVAGAVR